MNYKEQSKNYYTIEKAIQITNNKHQDLTLKSLASSVYLNETSFNKIITAWAGISADKFIKYLKKKFSQNNLNNSKDILSVSGLLNLSSQSRLNDHFVKLDKITPGEYKKMESIKIRFGIHPTPFGKALIGITSRGICELSFINNDKNKQIEMMKDKWPGAVFEKDEKKTAAYIDPIFNIKKPRQKEPISILVKGTNFQIRVWEALLKIPRSKLVSYNALAKFIGKPKAPRAVGTACGRNNIALIIPCHRVLTNQGEIGGYRWGNIRKSLIIGKEFS